MWGANILLGIIGLYLIYIVVTEKPVFAFFRQVTQSMIKKLDLYLLRHFLRRWLVVTLAIGLTIIVVNMVEQLRDFVDHQVPMLTILAILPLLRRLGDQVVSADVRPAGGAVFGLDSGATTRDPRDESEPASRCIASRCRICWPTILLAVGHFYYNEYLFPPLNQRRVEIKEFTIEKQSKAAHGESATMSSARSAPASSTPSRRSTPSGATGAISSCIPLEGNRPETDHYRRQDRLRGSSLAAAHGTGPRF